MAKIALRFGLDWVAVIELNRRRSNRYVEDFVIELRPKITQRCKMVMLFFDSP
jgi:hypothetical protein